MIKRFLNLFLDTAKQERQKKEKHEKEMVKQHAVSNLCYTEYKRRIETVDPALVIRYSEWFDEFFYPYLDARIRAEMLKDDGTIGFVLKEGSKSQQSQNAGNATLSLL